ncbi:PP2C family protein-serine/threonine phosphatase [Nonomuraea candida]|uniref:PP2C family protein-serine/threonine phosphatase n=1 Tax=Nonomuraea candida TaxID=359159 RepID=UPI0005B93254|nr:PP2C family protein-serine/threonine phosphatase [Nonomuraea candida]
MRSDGERALSGLLQALHLTAMEGVPPAVARCSRTAGFSHVLIYVTDLQQQLLVPLPGQHAADGGPLETLRIEGTVPGRAFRMVEIVRTRPGPAEGGGTRLWLPLLDGTERIGVLGLTVAPPGEPAPDPGDDPASGPGAGPDPACGGEREFGGGAEAACGGELMELRAKDLASLVALLVISKRPHSDSYARVIRARPLTLSAEVLWNLLPPGTFANDDVVVSAALEPAYEMGGDAFDYAISDRVLHLSIFDAMGHDTSAGLTASIAMGAFRNHRRRGETLAEAGQAIDAAIGSQFTGRFATGILADLDLRTGLLTWVNRGHHPPLVLREGRLVRTLESVPDPPMGFGLEAGTGVLRHQLQPGDRLLFYTDGIVEAQSPDGELFGLERFIEFVLRREADGVSAPETLRRLIQAILAHQRGRLQDDATVMTVEWQTRRRDQLVP